MWSPAEQTIRGGGIPHPDNLGGAKAPDLLPAEARRDATTGWFRVRAVDVGAWILTSFAPRDHVVVKMDIEGAEHALLREMMKTGALRRLDVLHVECHTLLKGAPDCKRLLRDLRAANPSMHLSRESKAFQQTVEADGQRPPSAAEMRERSAVCEGRLKQKR